jgi:hypothetical protein
MFGAGIVTDRLTNVYITNLPMDEQGNLKTAIVTSSKTMLVFNQTITIPSGLTNYFYLASFDTTGFRYAYVMAKARGLFQTGANIHIYVYDNNFGVQTLVTGGFGGFIQLDTTAVPWNPIIGSGASGRYDIRSSSNDLYLYVYNSDVGFNGLLTIVAYLTN